MRTPASLRATMLALVLCSMCSAARAQLPQPRLASVFPCGGGAGENVEITLTGTDLDGANALWFDHPGLRAFHIKGEKYRVAIAPGVPIGHHDVRVVSRFGISNPRTFVVGTGREQVEAEPNNTPGQANRIEINTTCNGQLASSPDVDCFVFEGAAGQRILVEIEAFSLDSVLTAKLRLRNAAGVSLAESGDQDAGDPLLDVTLPASGTYVVELQDLVYGGGPEYVYRLKVTDGPHIDAIAPVVATAGKTGEFTLIGRNLGGSILPGVTIDGRPVEKHTVRINAPDWNAADGPISSFLGSYEATRRGFLHTFESERSGRRSNAVFVALSDDPIIIEHEPNDPEHPQTLTPPCEVSGVFGTVGDDDDYRFEAKSGDIWWIEVSAERIGSPADPTFIVQKIVSNGAPQELATAEDLAEPVTNLGVPMASVDAVLRLKIPENGTYQIILKDLYGSQRGDPRFSYRLQIRPERPDYRLFVAPVGVAAQPLGLTLRRGGRAQATAFLVRIDGFDSAVRIEGRDLPPGVTMDPVVIGPGQFSAPIVLTAAEDCPLGIGIPTFHGHALNPDRKEVLMYQPGTRLRPEIERDALALATVRAATSLSRATRGFAVGVIEPGPFLLTAKVGEVVINQGANAIVPVELKRREGFSEAVQLTAVGLPPNVTVKNVAIAKDAGTANVELTATKNAPVGNFTLVLHGAGPYPFSKDPNAKSKPNVTVNEPANPVLIRVHK